MSQVSFDGGAFLLVDVQENPARYVKRLERAKITPGYAECLCQRVAAPLQLVIRRYGTLLHLAGWPEDGHRHARGCAFYKDLDAKKSGSGGDTNAAIIATATGLNAKLDVALTQRESQSGSHGSPAKTGQRSGRRSASLLAFLQTLWVTSGLNRWNGISTARHWGVCNAQILAELGDAVINGNNAQSVLHVMRRYQEAERAEINAEFDTFLFRVDVSVTKDGDYLILDVQDSGPGIPEDQLSRVLEPFYRMPATSMAGSGLGLSIVSEISRRSSGQLLLENVGGGLRARYWHPL